MNRQKILKNNQDITCIWGRKSVSGKKREKMKMAQIKRIYE